MIYIINDTVRKKGPIAEFLIGQTLVILTQWSLQIHNCITDVIYFQNSTLPLRTFRLFREKLQNNCKTLNRRFLIKKPL